VDTDCLGEDRLFHLRLESLAGDEIDRRAEQLFKVLLKGDKLQQSRGAADIGCFVAGDRTEER